MFLLNPDMKAYHATLAALLSGVLLALSYAPFDLWALAYVALVPLLLVIRSARLMQVVGYCGMTGVVLATSIYHGALGYGLIVFLVITIAFFFAFALWGGLTRWLLARHSGLSVALFAPALLWVGIETLAGGAPIGVPMYLGLSQVSQTPLIQSASWFGISGISFLIVLVNAALVYAITRDARHGRTAWFVPMGVGALVVANLGLGELHLAQPLSLSAPV
ncbi:MAG: hypothetical protein AAB263_21230, partial [Planctomycetota bacterium]